MTWVDIFVEWAESEEDDPVLDFAGEDIPGRVEAILLAAEEAGAL